MSMLTNWCFTYVYAYQLVLKGVSFTEILGAKFRPCNIFSSFFLETYSSINIFWSVLFPNFYGVNFFTLKTTKLLNKLYSILKSIAKYF